MSSMESLKGSGFIKDNVTSLDKSKLLDKGFVRTSVPIINLVLSGRLSGGWTSGISFFAGPSKHFKSNICLKNIAAYLREHKDATCVFYDCEYGITKEYIKSMGVDPKRVLHVPFKDIETLKLDLVKRLESIKRGDRVCFLVDSLGNSASKKELEDAKDGKSVADMSRAKAIKSLFRIITPYFTELDIPFVAVAHTYQTQDLFPKDVVGGGQGMMLGADSGIIIGRRQVKEGKEIVGYQFVLKVEKSRFIREKSQFDLDVTFEEGINPYSGMIQLGEQFGYVVKPSKGWYSRSFLNEKTGEMQTEDKKWRKADTNCTEFWKPLFKHKPFVDAVEDHYRLKPATTNQADVDKEIDELFD